MSDAPKTPAELEREVLAAILPDTRMARQAAYIKAEVERRTSARVDISEPRVENGHHLKISDAASGYYETFGVSKYGITPSEIRFGSKFKGGDKVKRIVDATVNKARKLK